MFCAVAQKLLQKRYHLEGSTAFMSAPVDVTLPYTQAERRLLDLVSDMGSQRCCCLPLSKRFGVLHNGGSIGEWIVVVYAWVFMLNHDHASPIVAILLVVLLLLGIVSLPFVFYGK